MSRISSSPALTEIAAALRKTTERLALELVVPGVEQPAWTDFEWRIARAVAAIQGISVILAVRMCWQGPDGWQRFLQKQRHHCMLRHLEIARLLTQIAMLASRDGIAVVALKGSALYRHGIYLAGERPMGDIDLLVRGNDAQAVAVWLRECEYEPAFASRRHEVFQPRFRKVPRTDPGEHIDNPIKIEVHTKIAEHLPVSEVDITRFVLDKEQSAGLNNYPSLASLLLHLLLHAAGNMRARALRQIQLHDIALLAARMNADDWEQLFAYRPTNQPLWWIWAPLCLTARYYPAAIRPYIIDRLATECPLLLRSSVNRQILSDVSWSNLRIAAFPGLEWSRTPFEALAFMKSRMWPSRTARLELSTNAAQIPGFSTIPWYGISHGARILRWIFRSSPRVQTLLAVRAVLAQD